MMLLLLLLLLLFIIIIIIIITMIHFYYDSFLLWFIFIIFSLQDLTTLKRTLDNIKDPLFRYFEREVLKERLFVII